MEKDHAMHKDGDFEPAKVDDVVDRIDQDKMVEKLQDFNDFKSYLSKRIELGRRLGLDEEQLAVGAQKVANYLADNVAPQNREEALLMELWQAGNEEERHMLAHMLVKWADS
ncbi:DUF3243 family protein [Neobacillus notoginsengisoli]|uniref:DUF3243 family protein n=1 Tax=Neobacillus notoginsengisoli TaxID=1578198 RepID=A0A417YS10_9BACI|nr:DUF3243 domain-containing protein [Neobacillus notoginsengisoli]RHW38071.1 DUF3243 family protein [Neobacillus notoginsengisoli]